MQKKEKDFEMEFKCTEYVKQSILRRHSANTLGLKIGVEGDPVPCSLNTNCLQSSFSCDPGINCIYVFQSKVVITPRDCEDGYKKGLWPC